MVVSAFPLADVLIQDAPWGKGREAGVERDGTTVPNGDFPFQAEPSADPSSTGAGDGAAQPGGSSSLPGGSHSDSFSAGRTAASGSVLIDQMVGAARLMGHNDVRVPDLPLDKLAPVNPLRAAIVEWLAVTGSQVPPEELAAELARADALPDPLQRDLAILLLSASKATILQHQALAQLTPEQLAWVYSNPDVGEQLARGVDTPQTRYMAALAGLVDARRSIEASLLMVQAVESTRGSLTQHEAQSTLAALQAGDLDESTLQLLRLLSEAPSRVSDKDKVRFAADIVVATTGIAAPEPIGDITFPDAVQQLLAATHQQPDAAALDAVLKRAALLPTDLQLALAKPLAAQAMAVNAANPHYYTANGQAEALARTLLAIADALPTFQKYAIYWRHAPDALRVAEWDPAVRAGWAAEHIALFMTARHDASDLARAGGLLVGAPLVDVTVPERSFEEAFEALALQAYFPVNDTHRDAVRYGAGTLQPAVREAAALMMSGAAESSRLNTEAFAKLTPEETQWLLANSHGLDLLYTKADITPEELERLTRASHLANKVDVAKLAAAGAVGAKANAMARDLLRGQDAFAAQTAVTELVPTGWKSFFAKLLPFKTARAQTSVGCTPIEDPVLGRPGLVRLDGILGARPTDQIRPIYLISNDCEQDVLLRIELPGLEFFSSGFGMIPRCVASMFVPAQCQVYRTCDDKMCTYSFYEYNTELLVITGEAASTHTPLSGVRITCPAQDSFCWFGRGTTEPEIEHPPQYGAPTVSLDLGGDDTYAAPRAMVGANATAQVSLHLDIGGSDFYADPTILYDERTPVFHDKTWGEKDHPSQASALYGGTAVLVDARGDDRYDAPSRSQGFGRFGFGLLLDSGGGDRYSGTTFVQGAASDSFSLGVGIIADLGGADTYSAETGQGYGLGGILLDITGRDRYLNDNPPRGLPAVKLDILPGGELTEMDERGDERFWLDGPGSINLGIGIDTEVTLSGRDSDSDGDSDFLEFVAGSDPDDPEHTVVDGPVARVDKVLVDEDGDLFPDFIERALSTDPNDPKSYPAGLPMGPRFLIPDAVASQIGGEVDLSDATTGNDGTPYGSDKILDLRLPLQNAGTIDAACVGLLDPQMGSPLGIHPGADLLDPVQNNADQLGKGSDGDAEPQADTCLWVTYATQEPGRGNGTLPQTTSQGKPFTFQLPAGILAVGDSIDTRYKADYFFVVDLGGIDTFENSAGGGLVVQTRPTGESPDANLNRTFLAPSLVINVDPQDLDNGAGAEVIASPDPQFESDAPSACKAARLSDCYANATRDHAHGSYWGLLLDTSGNELYHAGNVSQGSVGGLLLDLGGVDSYLAGDLSQGASLASSPRFSQAGIPGTTPSEDALARRTVPGILLDLGEDFADAFFAGNHSQGFGRGYATCFSKSDCTRGQGHAALPRSAPYAVGILLDQSAEASRSTYMATRNSQGVGGQAGMGVLLDLAGSDFYTATGPVSQGATISQTVGTNDEGPPSGLWPATGILIDAGNATLRPDAYEYTYKSRGGIDSITRDDRSDNLNIDRRETGDGGDGTRVYADLGIHLDGDLKDPARALAAIGGSGDSPVVDAEGTSFLVHLPTARLAIGDENPQSYTRQYAFVVDLGGRNDYGFSAGGFIDDMLASNHAVSRRDEMGDHAERLGLFPVTFLLDAGNDASTYNHSRPFSQGAGFFSVGLLVDLGGRDQFLATREAGPSIVNSWAGESIDKIAEPVIDGSIGNHEWRFATVEPITLTSLRDSRFNRTFTLRIMNDHRNLYLALEGTTGSHDSKNRTQDVLIVDLNEGRRSVGYDRSPDVNRTGIDQVQVSYSGERCVGKDRYFNTTGITDDEPHLGKSARFQVACRVESDGRFSYEIVKQLTKAFPYDGGDLGYAYDEDLGFLVRDLGLRIEWREAGAGYWNPQQGKATPASFAWPAGSTHLDGAAGFRKNDNLSDELSAWAVTTLASRAERGEPFLNIRNASVVQGAAVAGVGILATLGLNNSDATYTLNDRGLGYGAFSGLGVLIDTGGHDTYSASERALGAADSYGFGLAIEMEGHERYEVGDESLGWADDAGAASGWGVFMDLGGDDHYAYPPATTEEQDLSSSAGRLENNNRYWRQTNGIGVDYVLAPAVREAMVAALDNNVFKAAKPTLDITVHAPEADDADAKECTRRPVNNSPLGKPVVAGAACLIVTFNTSATGALAEAVAAARGVLTSVTVDVTSVDLFADHARLLTLHDPLHSQSRAAGRQTWVTPYDFSTLPDGVTQLKAVPTFTVSMGDYGTFLYRPKVEDREDDRGVRTVLINNPSNVDLGLGPAFHGVASSAFSPVAAGRDNKLSVNVTVSRDADEERLKAYQNWEAPPWFSNVPCQGEDASELCNVLPFYLSGDGKPLTTTPGSLLPGENSVHREPVGSGSKYTQLTSVLETPLTIMANGSFHLTIPSREPVFPLDSPYTKHILIAVVDPSTNGVVHRLAEGSFTQTRQSAATETLQQALSGGPGVPIDVFGTVSKLVKNVSDPNKGNPLVNLFDIAMNTACKEGDDCTGSLENVRGRYGYQGLRPCDASRDDGNQISRGMGRVFRQDLGHPWINVSGEDWAGNKYGGSVQVRQELWDTGLDHGSLCNYYAPYNVTRRALEDVDVGDAGQVLADTLDAANKLLLDSGRQANLNWTDFYLDVNQSLLAPGATSYTIPEGYQIKLEMWTDMEGLAGTLADVALTRKWDDLLEPALLEAVESAPIDNNITVSHKVVGNCCTVTVGLKENLTRSITSLRTSIVNIDQRVATGGLPAAIWNHSQGDPRGQPRLEVRIPTEPSTNTEIALQRLSGETVATIAPGQLLEGDVLGSPTTNGNVYDPEAPWFVDWYANATGRRFTQFVIPFDGASVEDGLYRVHVKSTDGAGYVTERNDTVLLDRTAPVTTVSTPSFAGKALLKDNQIPVTWSVVETGSRLESVQLFVKRGSEGLMDPTKWDTLKNESFPPEQREHLVTKGAENDYYFITVGVDRAGNVEANSEGGADLREAIWKAFQVKLGRGEGPLGYTKVVIDESMPSIGESQISGGRLLNYQGSDLQFLAAGQPVAFSICASDDGANGVSRVDLLLDLINASSGEILSHRFTATPSGVCANNAQRFVYEGWGSINTNKTLFPDGIWTTSFQIYDRAANSVTVSLPGVVLDSRAPTVALQDPIYPAGQSAVKPGDRLALRLYADDLFGVDDARIEADASALSTEQAAVRPVRVDGVLYQEVLIKVNRTNLDNGLYEVVLQVPDLAGNVRSVTAHVLVDFKKFAFESGSVRVTNLTHNSFVLHWATTENTTSGAKFGTTPVDLRGRTGVNETLVRNHTLLVEGLQANTRYFVRAISSTPGGFTLEADALEVLTKSALFIEPISPKKGDAVSGAVDVHFRGGLRDSTDFVTYTLEVQPESSANWTFVTTLTRQGQEHHLTFNSTRYLDGANYRLRLSAEAGKDKMEPVVLGPFLSDNTPPRVSVLAPLVATNDTTPRVIAEVYDNLAGFGATPADLFIDGEPVEGELSTDKLDGLGLRLSYDIPSALPAGLHTFELRATDKAGSTIVETWKVAVDGDAPVILANPTGFAPGTTAAKLGGTVTLNLSVTDASGVSLVTADASDLSQGASEARLVRVLGSDIWTLTVPVTAVDPAATKRVTVSATDLAGNTRRHDVDVPVDNVPPAVGGGSIVDIGHVRATLRANADEPVVLVATATAPRAPEVSFTTTEASRDARLVLEGLLPSRTYQYKVRAIDGAGNEASFSGSFATLKDELPPTSIGAISVADLHNGTLRLSWAPAEDDVAVAFYRIYRSDDGVTFRPVAEVKATTYEDGQLPYEKSFTYKIAAVDHGGNEGPADEKLSAAATALPKINVGLVTPTVGSAETTFRFVVEYVSPGGVPPAYVHVILDGARQNMTLENGSFIDGATYVYETRMAPHKRDEPHTYSFEASDGRYVAKFPEDGSSLRGPLVSGDVFADGDASGFANFAQRVPVGGIAGMAAAVLVAAAVVALAVRQKKGGSK